MKRVVHIRNAVLVPAETIWPGRCNPDDLVLRGELASEHPVLGAPRPAEDDALINAIRTSLVVKQDLLARTIETRNTVYQIVE